MAKDFMAQMLDELMGRNRNAAPHEKTELRWDDSSVCKHYLINYCPNELFTNTKADLGICRKLHDDELKRQYQASSQRGTLGYEDSFVRFLRTMVQEVDRRIDRGKGRLDATRQVAANSVGTKYDEKIKELADKIESLVHEAGQLGSIGKVEDAQLKLRQSDQLRKDRDAIKQTLEIAVQQEKQLEVCQTCGAFLIVGDAQQRIDDHLAGKQHVGYAKVRQTLKEEEERITKELEERRKEREKVAEDRDHSRSRSRRDSVKKEKAGDLDGKNGRTRSRERSRRSSSKDRDRHRKQRSRSDDRKRRNRSRSGSRKKERSPVRHQSSKHRTRSRSDDRNRHSTKHNKRDRTRSREDRRRSSRSRDEKRRRSRSPDEKRRRRRASSSSNASANHGAKKEENGTFVKKLVQQGNEPSLESIQLPRGNAPPEVPADDDSGDE